jgi:hypothetical protein
MEYFIGCVRSGWTPLENGHDGKAVVSAVHALYASAAERKRIPLPFTSDAERPIDLWKRASRRES